MGYLRGSLEQTSHWTEFWVFKIRNELRSPLIAPSLNHNSVQCIVNQDDLFRSPLEGSSTHSRMIPLKNNHVWFVWKEKEIVVPASILAKEKKEWDVENCPESYHLLPPTFYDSKISQAELSHPH